MSTNRIVKIAALNMGIAIFNIILFSQGLVGLQIGGENVLSTAFAMTTILMSIAVFIFGNYSLIAEKEKAIRTSELRTADDYIIALRQNYSKKTFEDDITAILEQMERLHKKTDTIKEVILQKFSSTEMSYIKFEGVLIDVSNVFYMNIKSVLNKLNAFDEHDYHRIMRSSAGKRMAKEIVDVKMGIYNEYISFIKGAIDDNEQILLKLDKLLLEISKLSSLEDGELENMIEMKGIEELIKQVKYYK